MDILVRHDYTHGQVRQAHLKSMEFKRNRYTSGCANLDDQIALGKAVILCDTHTRRFSPKTARYRAHPDKKLQRVIGNCDFCRAFGLSFLFINEKDALDEQRKIEKFKRALEYAHILTS